MIFVDTDDSEDIRLHDIQKRNFYKELEKYGIDLTKISTKRRSFNEDFHRFNLVVKNMKFESRLTMVECAKYLMNDYFKESEVLLCFNEENRYELEKEVYSLYRNTALKKYFKKNNCKG